MKRTFIAAATLLLTTSAMSGLAAADSTKPTAVDDPSDPVIAAKYAQAAQMKAGMGGPFEEAELAKPVVDDPNDPIIAAKYAQAAQMKAGMGGPFEEADLAKPVVDDPSDPIIAAKYAEAARMKAAYATGVGGPLEDGTSLAPRQAADNYPPCDPGPGDDRCIQLYEPGVRAQLAGWNGSTGGLADGSVTNAMGGPYEPLDGSFNESDLAMNGDGVVDTAHGETVDGGSADVDLAHHSQFSGVGGPIESQSGYPPCSPGPGDDRCIQLYERGVTGSDN